MQEQLLASSPLSSECSTDNPFPLHYSESGVSSCCESKCERVEGGIETTGDRGMADPTCKTALMKQLFASNSFEKPLYIMK